MDAEGLRKALTTRTRQTPDGPIVSPIDVKVGLCRACWNEWPGCMAACFGFSWWMGTAPLLPTTLPFSGWVAQAAEDNRDSLSKTIYSRMFDWLVERINTSIGQDPNAANLIGVLDIYGAPACRLAWGLLDAGRAVQHRM